MFSWITSRTRRRRNAQKIYGSIVALSRTPALYSDYGVPDTVEGRFEILVLHMFAAL
jgi:cytochrome b pre-mRNA-processing protein 3